MQNLCATFQRSQIKIANTQYYSEFMSIMQKCNKYLPLMKHFSHHKTATKTKETNYRSLHEHIDVLAKVCHTHSIKSPSLGSSIDYMRFKDQIWTSPPLPCTNLFDIKYMGKAEGLAPPPPPLRCVNNKSTTPIQKRAPGPTMLRAGSPYTCLYCMMPWAAHTVGVYEMHAQHSAFNFCHSSAVKGAVVNDRRPA